MLNRGISRRQDEQVMGYSTRAKQCRHSSAGPCLWLVGGCAVLGDRSGLGCVTVLLAVRGWVVTVRGSFPLLNWSAIILDSTTLLLVNIACHSH